MSQEPFILSLDQGTHYLCSCGQSKNAPYCDGSHKGTGLQPLVLELESPKTVVVSDWQRALPTLSAKGTHQSL